MTSAPPVPSSPRVRLFLVLGAALLTSCGGCRKEAAPAPPAEDAAERLAKAWVMYRQAEATQVPEKYEVFRRLVALYDDTEPGRNGYLEMIVSMTHDQPPQTAEALKVARMFRDRHPKDERVGEAYREIADTLYPVKDDPTRAAALAEWEAHLIERDVANDVPKPGLFLDFVRLRIRQERWPEAEVAIETALAEPGITKADRVELLVRKGNLLSEKLGRRDDARAALEQALDLSRELHAMKASQRAIPPDRIEEELKKLEKG